MSSAPRTDNAQANAHIILKVAKAIGAHLEMPEVLAALNETLEPIREYVPEVEKELSRTNTREKKLALDLTEVTFVDRAAMTFLCAARSKNIAIQHAPLYVGLWMEQEDRQGNCDSD